MNRKEFLAIIPGIAILNKVKIQPSDLDFISSKPVLLSSLQRATFTNVKEKQQEYLDYLKKGMLTPNEIRENEDL